MVLQLADVGHREARAIDNPDSVSFEPKGRGLGRQPHLRGDLFQQLLKDGQRQTLSSLAVGRLRELPDTEVDNVLASRVAVQDLEQEKINRRGGVEDSIAPSMSGGLAGMDNRIITQAGSDIFSQSRENGANAWWHGVTPFG
jgi:hypothetical protein